MSIRYRERLPPQSSRAWWQSEWQTPQNLMSERIRCARFADIVFLPAGGSRFHLKQLSSQLTPTPAFPSKLGSIVIRMPRMEIVAQDRSALTPLPYHFTVVDYLRQHEADVWRWAAARTTGPEQREALRAALLRGTYRIERDAHPDVHAALALALGRLGIDVPATLYQSPGADMNASLLYVPGEVHILVQGPLLERLAPDELLAVLGHELAHYLLWAHDDGQLLVADRILDQAAGSPGASASHLETGRRYALHTELFADRGAAVAAGALAPAIAALVKVQTGMHHVDAAAYLRQAEEIEATEEAASSAQTHPETFLRARALALWWQRSDSLPTWLEARLHGRLALERLDLPGQLHVQECTRGLVAWFLADTALASDALLAQVRLLFPDWSGADAPRDPLTLAGDGLDDYWNAMLVDLALADPDQQDAALRRAAIGARAIGSFDGFEASLRRDAGMNKRELDRFKRQLGKENDKENNKETLA